MSNAVDLNYVLETIYSWIASRRLVNNQHVFLEDPNADRPSPPSISYRMLSGPTLLGTNDNHKYDVAEDADVVSGHRTMSISLKSYGDNAIQNMVNLQASLELFSVQQYFQTRNIAIWNIGAVIEISSTLDTGIEERGQMDLILGVSSIQVDNEGAIEHIVLKDATINDEVGEVAEVINETIDKP